MTWLMIDYYAYLPYVLAYRGSAWVAASAEFFRHGNPWSSWCMHPFTEVI